MLADEEVGDAVAVEVAEGRGRVAADLEEGVLGDGLDVAEGGEGRGADVRGREAASGGVERRVSDLERVAVADDEDVPAPDGAAREGGQ